jgi:hypothetical protein
MECCGLHVDFLPKKNLRTSGIDNWAPCRPPPPRRVGNLGASVKGTSELQISEDMPSVRRVEFSSLKTQILVF